MGRLADPHHPVAQSVAVHRHLATHNNRQINHRTTILQVVVDRPAGLVAVRRNQRQAVLLVAPAVEVKRPVMLVAAAAQAVVPRDLAL